VIFEPSTRDMELIASLSIARAPPARIAAALGISEPEYAAWCTRLALGRAYVPAVVIPARRVRVVPERLRYRAERYFEAAVDAPPTDEAEIEAAVRFYSVPV
jgi:hypothetical protein